VKKTIGDAAKSVANVIRNNIRKEIEARLASALSSQLAKVFGSVPFPANVILAPIAGAAVRSLFNKLIPKFDRGTVLKGPDHVSGGIDLFGKTGGYYGNAEGGEVIINKKSAAAFQQELNAINTYKGYGKKLFQDGGTLSTVTTNVETPRVETVFQPVLILDTLEDANLKRQKIVKLETLL